MQVKQSEECDCRFERAASKPNHAERSENRQSEIVAQQVMICMIALNTREKTQSVDVGQYGRCHAECSLFRGQPRRIPETPFRKNMSRRMHSLPNVKDEPRRELARLVREHEA